MLFSKVFNCKNCLQNFFKKINYQISLKLNKPINNKRQISRFKIIGFLLSFLKTKYYNYFLWKYCSNT